MTFRDISPCFDYFSEFWIMDILVCVPFGDSVHFGRAGDAIFDDPLFSILTTKLGHT